MREMETLTASHVEEAQKIAPRNYAISFFKYERDDLAV